MKSTDVQPARSPRPKTSGIPLYMGTFADLMTLLLCLFVLLLSMAEIDALKYKIVVKSMENAFGVDNPQPQDIVKATSVIKQTFSPNPDVEAPISSPRQLADNQYDALRKADLHRIQLAQLQTLKQRLQQELEPALSQGLITLETRPDRVLIRINEHASFPSGSAQIKPGFQPVLGQIAEALSTLDAQFIVAGHTDNRPLNTARFRSNWELSAARSSSVVQALLDDRRLLAHQFYIEGYADTSPLKPNNTAAGRALNRRVEIGIINR